MYTIMIIRPKWRTYVAAITAVIFAAAGISPLAGIPSAIDWNVLMMISGTMVVVDLTMWRPSSWSRRSAWPSAKN